MNIYNEQRNKLERLFAINMDIDTSVIDPESNDLISARKSFIKFIPRLLSILDRYNIKATFFIVAKFAKDKVITEVIKEIAENGHEIANHSLSHYKHLSNFSFEDVYREIEQADKILSDVIGQKIYGFRAPGFCLSVNILKTLRKLNYLYDASLNTSMLYYMLKLIWLKIFRTDPKLVKLQPFSHCFLSSQPFFIKDSHLQQDGGSGDDGDAICEIPIPKISFISFPLLGTLVNKNSLLAKSYYWLVRHNQYLHLLLHDIEFAEYRDLDSERNIYTILATKDVSKHIRLYDKLVRYVGEDYTFTTLKEIALHFAKNG